MDTAAGAGRKGLELIRKHWVYCGTEADSWEYCGSDLRLNIHERTVVLRLISGRAVVRTVSTRCLVIGSWLS